ncbi:phage/plasmid primase, P4 family, partial [Halogeometricum luteum]
ELDYDERVVPGDVSGSDWKTAYNYLRSIGDNQFNLPELTSSRDSDEPEREPPNDTETWEYVRYLLEEGEGPLARETARRILREKHHPVVDETAKKDEQMLIYDHETGTYNRSESTILAEIADGLGEEWNTRMKHEIVEGLKQLRRLTPAQFNGRDHFDEPHVCVKNGVLNLFTGELKDHSPKYVFVDRIPTRYDPDADTGRFEEFMDTLTARDADAKAMLEMVGHALVPDAYERGWPKFLMLHGDSDNGKSFFYDLVGEMLSGEGERNIGAVKLQKMTQNQFSKNSIYGKMANIAGEIDGKRVKNTADLKDLTGGDLMDIEPKGGTGFFDTMNTTLMFAANDPPIIGDRDPQAIAKRIVPIELPYTFVENPDPNDPMQKQKVPKPELKGELASEAGKSALLNLALDGIQRLRENGGDVSLPESYMERLDMYEGAADPMKEFAKRCITTHESDYIVKDDVARIFREWADNNGVELGSNVSTTLFKTLDYGSVYPRNPDYAGVSHDLRGWDERKYAVPRVTLTEEGKRMAEKAGLVVDPEEADTDTSDPVQSGREYRTVAAVAESRKAYENVKAEVVSVDSIGDNGTKAVLRDDTGSIDVVQWDGDSLSEFEGEEVAIDDAEVSEYDGRVQFVFRSHSRITVTAASVREEGQSPVTADGGKHSEKTETNTSNPTGKDEKADTNQSGAAEKKQVTNDWRTDLMNAYRSLGGGDVEKGDLKVRLSEKSGREFAECHEIVEETATENGYLVETGSDTVEATDKLNGGEER